MLYMGKHSLALHRVATLRGREGVGESGEVRNPLSRNFLRFPVISREKRFPGFSRGTLENMGHPGIQVFCQSP